MRIEKRVLNDALRVLCKVVCQTSPVELYRSVRFVGDENNIRAMVTDGVETVSVEVDAFAETEIDFCVPFKELKDLVRMGVVGDGLPSLRSRTSLCAVEPDISTPSSLRAAHLSVLLRPPL